MPRRRARPARGTPSSPAGSWLDRLLDRVPDVVFRVRLSPRPRLEYISRAVLAVTGYSPQEWYSDPALALRIIHVADRRRLHDLARSRRLPQQPVELCWTRKDGAQRRTEISATAVYSRRGTLAAIEGIARDVTMRRPDPAGARGGDRFLRVAFDEMPVGAAHLGADGRFLHVNRRLCEMTGFMPEELLARHFRDIAHPDDVDRGLALLQQVRTSDAPLATIENRVICKDGSPAWVKMTAGRLRDTGNGGSIAVIEEIVEPAARARDQPRLTYCGIEVDTDRLEVTWGGRRVAVTLKEVLLLRYLIRHRGEMLARDRLLRDVWGYEHAGRSRTLDVHICRLRRKLPPLADSLATIGHFGYTLSQGVPGASAVGS